MGENLLYSPLSVHVIDKLLRLGTRRCVERRTMQSGLRL